MTDDPTTYIDPDGIARIPEDEFRKLLIRAAHGAAMERKLRDQVTNLIGRARRVDQDIGHLERAPRLDPQRINAMRMEAAGYRAEAMVLAIKAL